jgi:hypothetical protein
MQVIHPETKKVSTDETPNKQPYEKPTLIEQGSWSALTLQVSVPIGPGGFLPFRENA